MVKNILILDDEESIRLILNSYFSKFYKTFLASNANEAFKIFSQEFITVAIVDLKLPDFDGIEILKKIKEISPSTKVIILTAYGDIDKAVLSMKEGAEHFLTKPVNLEVLKSIIEKAIESVEFERDYRFLQFKSKQQCTIQESELFLPASVKKSIKLLAENPNTSAIIIGETGTGKGVVARTIHNLSIRSKNSFIEINCACLSENLLSSELFGYEKGAFTDAKSSKAGLLEIANGGTFFLDEIGEMALPIQAQILKVIEDHKFRRIGGTREITTDVRILAATNSDLEKKVEKGLFRKDLYFRLNVFTIYIPPLREHPEDIIPLAEHFLKEFSICMNHDYGKIPKDVKELLLNYTWPGNVRELRNVIERAIILCGRDKLKKEHFNFLMQRNKIVEPFPTLKELEKNHILEALRLSKGNKSKAAKMLGIHRYTLLKKLKELNLKQYENV